MKAYVYTDKSLERFAGRFVWLSVNTENAKNAAFLAKFKIPALPTLLVLDERGESIVLRYVGGATAGQLTKLLDDVRRKSGTTPDAVLAAADKLAGEGKQKEAAAAYLAALSNAPKGWSRFGRTAESYVLALSSSGDNERCATEARRLLPAQRRTVSGATLAAVGLGCAAALDEKSSLRSDLLAALDTATRAAFDDAKLDISADDRSGLYISLIEARDAVKDAAGARKLRQEWARFLEDAAARARTPDQRTVYDSHRLSAYLGLETPEKAIAMLEQSERDFPDDYNPPARLAAAYRAMKKYDDAVAAADRALSRAYGPRKLTIFRTKAEVLAAQGDKPAARAALAEAVAYAHSLPAVQQRQSVITALEKRSRELEE
ncbi:MAG: thioredoxin family protein [Thermoanaerobaculia bacterium]|nr:thioredoxin family protein [Thermoanaerobaculia bacterium]